MESVLRVKRLTPYSTLPARATEGAAGYDLSSAIDTVVATRGKALVMTDLAIAIPHNYYGRIAPRSGLAWKNHIDVGGGVIDSDYRGNVGVVLFNHGESDLIIRRGDRIAQLLIEKIITPAIQEVEDFDPTIRGSNGFGSTNISPLG